MTAAGGWQQGGGRILGLEDPGVVGSTLERVWIDPLENLGRKTDPEESGAPGFKPSCAISQLGDLEQVTSPLRISLFTCKRQQHSSLPPRAAWGT